MGFALELLLQQEDEVRLGIGSALEHRRWSCLRIGGLGFGTCIGAGAIVSISGRTCPLHLCLYPYAPLCPHVERCGRNVGRIKFRTSSASKSASDDRATALSSWIDTLLRGCWRWWLHGPRTECIIYGFD